MNEYCADVITTSIFDDPLLYRISDQLNISIGTIVKVPFGKNHILGIVVGVRHVDIDKVEFPIKDIERVVYDGIVISADLISLIRWMYIYYAATVKSLIEAILPASIRSEMPARKEVYLSVGRELSHDECEKLKRRSKKQYEIYDMVRQSSCQIKKRDIVVISSSE